MIKDGYSRRMTPVRPTPTTRALGAALTDVMKASGLSQYRLARMLGWNASTISRLRRGQYNGQARHIIPILDACNVDDETRERIMALRIGCIHCGCRDLTHQIDLADVSDAT